MKKELDDLLCRRYPLIFANRHGSPQETAMCWGFSCGDGWFDLIDTLCERLQFWTDRNRAPQVVAGQVKQKLGELRFYLHGEATGEQLGMIYMAAAMSRRLCEQCGKPGETLIHECWFMTRCTEHAPEGAVTEDVYCAQNPPGIAR